MRIVFPIVVACIMTFAAQAQPASVPASTAKTHTHLSMEQRFANANTTHDGHLTLDQAKTGYPTIARHFDAIDKDKKGYVTTDDIRAYYKTQRALHHQASSTAPKSPNS
jgi:hypothetical protein